MAGEHALWTQLRCRVVARHDVDPRRQPGYTADHGALLREIDGAATLLELLATWGRDGAGRALAALVDLHRWGVCALVEAPAATTATPTPPTAVVAPAAAAASERPAAPPPTDRAAPAERVDLDDRTRQRILDAVTMLRDGRVLELLGVDAGADRAALKRAYYALAKEFHPDRFYGKELGSFAGHLSTVFEAAAQAIKTLTDPRTMLRDASATGHHRRRSPRYAIAVPLRMRCESWPETLWLTTREIGAGGMFVATDTAAAIGERAAFELTLPDRSPLMLSGRVVDFVQGRGQRPSGLCVQFAPLGEADRQRFAGLLDTARAASAAPADSSAEHPAPAGPRFARGSGGVRAMTPIVGIDFGTTFMSVSARVGGKVHVLPFPSGARSLPTVVAFPRRGEIVVGEAARDRLATDPRHTVASAKRLLGRRADDKEIQGQISSAGYQTLTGPDGELFVDMWGEPLAIPQLCGYMLTAARAAAERVLNRPIGGAVLSAPVSFGPDKVELLRRAARLAHIDVVDVVDEPSAAALANRFRPEFDGLVGIYDFGGGTFDFSVIDTQHGDFRVVTTAGDSWLGGDDFDHVVADALANLYWKSSGIDLRQRAAEWQQLILAVESAKRALSSSDETELGVADVLHTAAGASGLRARLRRPQAERLWLPLIERSLNTCLQTLALVGLRPKDLSAIYLSGGTTHIPMVRSAIQSHFGIAPTIGVPPDYAVCLGAGVQAAQIEEMREPTLAAQSG